MVCATGNEITKKMLFVMYLFCGLFNMCSYTKLQFVLMLFNYNSSSRHPPLPPITCPFSANSNTTLNRIVYAHNLRIFIKHNLLLYAILFVTKLLVSMRVRDECAPQGAYILWDLVRGWILCRHRSSGMLMSGNASDII